MLKSAFLFIFIANFQICNTNSASTFKKIGHFDPEKDLLLAHFDCKTDVDDLHTVAAFATLLSKPAYNDITFHAVAGTYGTQEGLYVPANELFDLAFGQKWSDAHNDFKKALQEVKAISTTTLQNGGDLWIAEAGQSDFSAALIKELESEFPDLDLKEKIHLVQHSDWNESVTSKEALSFVQENIDYHKIPDGNAEGNGTPGFRSPDIRNWLSKINDDHITKVWKLAVELGNQYNGADGRYLNKAVKEGGLDFSDLSEVCWILGQEELKNADAFFDMIREN